MGYCHRIGYVRVSSFEQHPERQLDKVFTDKASWKDTQRPALETLLAFACEGDTVVVREGDTVVGITWIASRANLMIYVDWSRRSRDGALPFSSSKKRCSSRARIPRWPPYSSRLDVLWAIRRYGSLEADERNPAIVLRAASSRWRGQRTVAKCVLSRRNGADPSQENAFIRLIGHVILGERGIAIFDHGCLVR